MRNKVEVCDKGPEENPYKAGTMWALAGSPRVVCMITEQGYIDLSNGLGFSSTKFRNAFKNYTQVYCVTIKRDRSG